MNGKHILLMLAHLFRKYGKTIPIEDAVHILSFQWRYANPTTIRKILTLAEENEMISISGDAIEAEFLYDSQILKPNQVTTISQQAFAAKDVSPLY